MNKIITLTRTEILLEYQINIDDNNDKQIDV